MIRSPRRVWRVVAAGLAVSSGFLVLLPARASSPVLGSYGGSADGVAVGAKILYSGFASLFPIVDGSLAHVAGLIDSRPGARAYAAAADPGTLIQGLPAFGVPVPAWPYVARGEYPTGTRQQRTTAGEQDVAGGTARGLVSEASATDGPVATSFARTGSYENAAGLSTGLATSRATISSDGTRAISRIESTVHDVVVADALRIETVRTTVEASADGVAGGARAVHRVQISGVSLAGQEATIDETGVHLPGQALPGTPAQLLGAGVHVGLGSSGEALAQDGQSALAYADGLVVRLTAPDGSVVEFRLGSATVTTSATLAPPPLPEPTATAEPPVVLPPLPPVPQPVATQTVIVSPSAPTVARPVAVRLVGLPTGLASILALAQIVFWSLLAFGWRALPEPVESAETEWFFDVIDRVHPLQKDQ